MDNDCNGQVDEGLLNTYYLDNDGDGLGNINVVMSACSVPAGFTTVAGDCNDSNANATTLGSDASCARESCLAIHAAGPTLSTRTCWIQPSSTVPFKQPVT